MSSSTSGDVSLESNEVIISSTGSILQSDLISILVGAGAKKQQFIVHKDVLTKYQYFRKCLEGSFAEAQAKQIELPEDDAEIFAKVLEFIYFSTVPYELDWLERVNTSEKSPDSVIADVVSCKIVKTYIVADKLCIEALMNDLHDVFRNYHSLFTIAGDVMQLMIDCGPPTSLIREWAIKSFAYELRLRGWDNYKAECEENWCFVEKNAVELLRISVQEIRDSALACDEIYDNPNPCRWHVHVETPRCDATDAEKKKVAKRK